MQRCEQSTVVYDPARAGQTAQTAGRDSQGCSEAERQIPPT